MILNNLNVTIPRDKVLSRLKYNVHKTESTSTATRLVDEMICEARALLEPVASIVDFDIEDILNDSVTLKCSDFVIKGKSISEHLQRCHKVTFLVCTIGDVFNDEIKRYLEIGEVAKAAVLDAVASETVEELANVVNGIVEQNAAADGSGVIQRYSPGYGDWNIDVQPALLKLTDAGDIGVTLKENFMMSPEKSISACIGWKKKTSQSVRGVFSS